MKVHTLSAALPIVACFVAACGDSNESPRDANPNGNKVRDSSALYCPGNPYGTARVAELTQSLLGDEQDAGDGPPAPCVAWERLGERDLRLTFTGVLANCSVDWEPRAAFADGALSVSLFNTSCIYAACSCAQGMEVTVEDLDLESELALTLKQTEKCEDEGGEHPDHVATLVLGDAQSGETCLERRDVPQSGGR